MKSVGGAEYFLTFIDDFSRYVSVYFLKRKDEVFSCFLGWKAMVERATGRKLKVLRSDNGGEYKSDQFVEYLRSEGVRHELTVALTVALNRMESQRGLTEHWSR